MFLESGMCLSKHFDIHISDYKANCRFFFLSSYTDWSLIDGCLLL